MIDISKKFNKVLTLLNFLLGRIWNLSRRNKFAEKLSKNAGGAFLDFPRFANAHCTVQNTKVN